MAPKGTTTNAPAKEPQHKAQDAQDIKAFEAITDNDVEQTRRSIDEVRAHSNSAMAQVIGLAGARASMELQFRDRKGKPVVQDPRVKERAKERGADAVRSLRMYIRKIEEEVRAIAKTVA